MNDLAQPNQPFGADLDSPDENHFNPSSSASDSTSADNTADPPLVDIDINSLGDLETVEVVPESNLNVTRPTEAAKPPTPKKKHWYSRK